MLGKHGWHCYCAVCKVGKGIGLIRVCEKCSHASHKKVVAKKKIAKKKSKK